MQPNEPAINCVWLLVGDVWKQYEVIIFCSSCSCQYLVLLVQHERCFLITCLEPAAALSVSITLWKLCSRQLKHLSKCSTWWLPALYTQLFSASTTSVESWPCSGDSPTEAEAQWGWVRPGSLLSVCIHCDEDKFQLCHFLFSLHLSCVQNDSGSMTQPKERGSSDVLVWVTPRV